MKIRHIPKKMGVALAAFSLGATGLLALTNSGPAGAAGSKTITLGFIDDNTGLNASVFGGGFAAAQARLDVQNAKGGVDGYKLKLVTGDTQSSTQGALTAANAMISKGVFGIGVASAFMTLADKVIQKAGVIETGEPLEPLYDNAPYSNIFLTTAPTTVQGKDPVDGDLLQFLKDKGVTRWADLTWADIPSIVTMAQGWQTVSPKFGLTVCLLDTTIPIGTVDFTAVDLEMKQNNCNGSNGSWDVSSSIGFQQSLRNAGLANKVVDIQPSAYVSSVLTNSTAHAAGQGGYYGGQYNFTTPNAGGLAMLQALHKYAPSICPQVKGCLPNNAATAGWIGMDQIIFGLQKIGKNPTPAKYIKYMRTHTVNYTANGLIPSAWNWTNFGSLKSVPKNQCEYVFKLAASGFVPATGPGIKNGLVCAPTYFVPAS